jgi:hypothetical protein
LSYPESICFRQSLHFCGGRTISSAGIIFPDLIAASIIFRAFEKSTPATRTIGAFDLCGQ